MEPPTHLRLLPWLSAEGKPCFLAPATKGGYLSALADETESLQMDTGTEVLARARRVLDNPCVPNVEVRYAAIRLAECLGDVLRVAESRGRRLIAAAAATAAEAEDDGPPEPRKPTSTADGEAAPAREAAIDSADRSADDSDDHSDGNAEP